MTHAESATRYCKDIASGKKPACRWIKLACKRHLSDLERSKTKAFPYRFDVEKAERACYFASIMPHVKGEWCFFDHETREWNTISLEPWQEFILASLFGWVKKTNGMRRFTKSSLYIPRKNAKSTLAACIGLFMFVADNEPGAEVFSGATSRKQAMEVFKTAWIMVKKCPGLAERYGITITGQTTPGPLVTEDGAKFEPVIGKPGDGASPHCSITDEYHEHPTSELVDTMTTGMGARRQPLSLIVSTAGSNLAGPCREDWKACESMLEAIDGFVDETHFAMIWTIDEAEAWDSEAALEMANPNWGISVNPEVILPALEVAKRDPREQAKFKTKHLNLWVQAKEAYYNIDQWDKLANKALKPEDFIEFPCYVGVDPASTHDLTALMQLFCLPEKRFALFGRYYLPEATINLPENQHYQTWVRGGWVTQTDGNVTDMTRLIDDADEMAVKFKVEELLTDPTRAYGIEQFMQAKGIPVVQYRQTILTMSEPMKHLDAMIRSGSIVHNGDPVLAWAISNVTGKADKKENVYPNKETPRNKIDPVIGALFCIGRAIVRPEVPAMAPGFSFY